LIFHPRISAIHPRHAQSENPAFFPAFNLKGQNIMNKKYSVLFLCSANSCRSQIAEGLLRHFGEDRFEAASAGTHPTSLHPLAVAVMREIGIDISSHYSKSIDELSRFEFDYVITVCDKAREFCPIFPGATMMLHWNIDDPAAQTGSSEEQTDAFVQAREKLKDLIIKFISSGSRVNIEVN
jgi:arsenate reductase (thioredoxin)